LASSLRSTLYKIVEIAEARFEQLVNINWATVLRCPWIANYRVLPKLFVKIEQLLVELFKAIATATDRASVPLKPGHADDKISSFVEASKELTKNIGRSLGFEFNAYKALQAKRTETKLELAPVQLSDGPTSTADKIINFLKPTIGPDKSDEKREDKKPGFKQYSLQVVTADVLGAGTDANVFCMIVGSKARTGKIELGEDESNSRFEHGSVDTFTIDVESDLGEVKELVLGHDNKGGGSDWIVKEARLADLGTQSVYSFACNNTTIGGTFAKKEKLQVSFVPEKQ